MKKQCKNCYYARKVYLTLINENKNKFVGCVLYDLFSGKREDLLNMLKNNGVNINKPISRGMIYLNIFPDGIRIKVKDSKETDMQLAPYCLILSQDNYCNHFKLRPIQNKEVGDYGRWN